MVYKMVYTCHMHGRHVYEKLLCVHGASHAQIDLAYVGLLLCMSRNDVHRANASHGIVFNFSAHSCHSGTAGTIKHPVPDRVKPSFVSFDIRAL